MGEKSARQYNRDQAKSVADGIGRILDRINRKYTPNWMILELERSYHTAQCVQAEFERMQGEYGTGTGAAEVHYPAMTMEELKAFFDP